MELPEIYSAEKTLSVATEWAGRDLSHKHERLTFVAPLDIDGVTIPGLRLRGTVLRTLPDEAASFMLEYHRPRQHGAQLARIEWRPLKGHRNKGVGPADFRFVDINGSHHHRFDLNWSAAASQVRRGNLPIAVPLSEDDIPTYADLLALVGKEFRINGIENIPPPPWEPRLV